MAEYLVQDTTLTAIANAVRAKKGTTEPIALTDFAAEIESIQSGGGSSSNKLALVVGIQSADNLYDITASDLDGVTEIGDYAFYQKTGLRSIDLSNVTSVGGFAFYNCSNLTSANMPNVTSIGSNTFAYCNALESVDMSKVISIGDSAFDSCGNFRRITIPASVTNIGSSAFRKCNSLTSVTFGENSQLTTIGSNAFYGTYISSISIPDSVTTIGSYAFYKCPELFSLKFGENSQLSIIDEYAFADNDNLSSVTIPASVTSIGNLAFYGCAEMTSVKYKDNSQLTSIGKQAFSYCPRITYASLPKSLTSIGEKAFQGCSMLLGASLAVTSLTSIGNYAFAGTKFSGSGYSQPKFPSTLKSMGSYIFQNCTSIVSITFTSQTPPTITSTTFSGLSYLEKLIVPVGCGEAYKTATNWSKYASYIVEATE